MSQIIGTIQKTLFGNINAARAEAIALMINSRGSFLNYAEVSITSKGGSPVQSAIILDKVKKYCKNHELPLYTFPEDKIRKPIDEEFIQHVEKYRGDKIRTREMRNCIKQKYGQELEG